MNLTVAAAIVTAIALATGNWEIVVGGIIGGLVMSAIDAVRTRRAEKARQARVIADNAAQGIETHFVSMKAVRREMRREARETARNTR